MPTSSPSSETVIRGRLHGTLEVAYRALRSYPILVDGGTADARADAADRLDILIGCLGEAIEELNVLDLMDGIAAEAAWYSGAIHMTLVMLRETATTLAAELDAAEELAA